jgi:hypothetical protein
MEYNLLGKNLVIVNPGYYFVTILIFSTVIRIIMNVFKMLAVKLGEADVKNEKGKIIESFSNKWSHWKTFWILFGTCGNHHKLDDFFLPTILGLFELVFFSIVIKINRLEIIAFWLTIKTAAQWNRWQISRTPYMRFLLGNVLMLFAAFILSTFITLLG